MIEVEDVKIRCIKKLVSEVRKLAKNGDYEVAHSKADSIYKIVLTSIANGDCVDPSGCAKAALAIEKIKFDRHCA